MCTSSSCPPRAECLWQPQVALTPPSKLQLCLFGKGVTLKEGKSFSSWKPLLLNGLIRVLALPLLLQGGQCEDRACGWHGRGRGWRRGRGGGGGGCCLLSRAFGPSCGGGATIALHGAGGRGSNVTPRSSSWRLPSGIVFGLPPHQLPFPSATLPPQVSVLCWRGSGGWGRLVLLGFPTGVSETGQRRTKPHPAPSWALYGFLQLLQEWTRFKHPQKQKKKKTQTYHEAEQQHKIIKVNIQRDELWGRLVE